MFETGFLERKVKKLVEINPKQPDTSLEDAILEELKERDMTGRDMYFTPDYVKEFSRKGLQVNPETLWTAINSLADSGRVNILKVKFAGGPGFIITSVKPRKRKAPKAPGNKPPRVKIIGKLTKEEYEKILEDNRKNRQ
jgi:hypothetical protein